MTAPPPQPAFGQHKTEKRARKRRVQDHLPKGGGRRKGAKNISWDPIRLAYVQGRIAPSGKPELPSYADLATEFGVPLGSIAKVGGSEDWPKLRAEHQALLGSQIQKVAIDRIAEAVAEVAAESASTCGIILQRIKKLVTPERVMPTAADGQRSAIGAAPAGALTEPELSAETIEKAQGLSVVYRNICQGTKLLTGGGGSPPVPPPPGSGTGESVERDPPISAEAQAAVDEALGAAARANRTPTTVTGAVPGAED